jgi:hypothetical protein
VSEGSLDSVVADRLDDVRPLQTNKKEKNLVNFRSIKN